MIKSCAPTLYGARLAAVIFRLALNSVMPLPLPVTPTRASGLSLVAKMLFFFKFVRKPVRCVPRTP